MVKFVMSVLLGLVISLPVSADQGQEATITAEAQKTVQVGNKLCPVSGEKVGDMGEPVPYEYKGKVYHLCCAMCAKEFDADPEKYSKIADDEVAAEKAGT